jgi:four helix bundle protein
MMGVMKEFETEDVWKRSTYLSAQIYEEFIGFKDLGYKDQIRQAGLFIFSNIAEEYERENLKQFSYFQKLLKVQQVCCGPKSK